MMADRDKYGNYVNDKGVTIKINTDKNSILILEEQFAKPLLEQRFVKVLKRTFA